MNDGSDFDPFESIGKEPAAVPVPMPPVAATFPPGALAPLAWKIKAFAGSTWEFYLFGSEDLAKRRAQLQAAKIEHSPMPLRPFAHNGEVYHFVQLIIDRPREGLPPAREWADRPFNL